MKGGCTLGTASWPRAPNHIQPHPNCTPQHRCDGHSTCSRGDGTGTSPKTTRHSKRHTQRPTALDVCGPYPPPNLLIPLIQLHRTFASRVCPLLPLSHGHTGTRAHGHMFKGQTGRAQRAVRLPAPMPPPPFPRPSAGTAMGPRSCDVTFRTATPAVPTATRGRRAGDEAVLVRGRGAGDRVPVCTRRRRHAVGPVQRRRRRSTALRWLSCVVGPGRSSSRRAGEGRRTFSTWYIPTELYRRLRLTRATLPTCIKEGGAQALTGIGTGPTHARTDLRVEEGHEATDTGRAYAPVSQAHGHHHSVQCFALLHCSADQFGATPGGF